MASNGVSVVTTTWNEAENIERLVFAVKSILIGIPHEVIVIDDCSTDDTYQVAKKTADIAVCKTREGQTKGLLCGMLLAKYPAIVTIDADLENDPAHIPSLIQATATHDIVVASRTKLPRFSEKIASGTMGKIIGVTDVFSNFRSYRREVIPNLQLKNGETFGLELLVRAKKMGLKIGELCYDPPPRRKHPRIGGAVRANARIIWALLKAIFIYIH